MVVVSVAVELFFAESRKGCMGCILFAARALSCIVSFCEVLIRFSMRTGPCTKLRLDYIVALSWAIALGEGSVRAHTSVLIRERLAHVVL